MKSPLYSNFAIQYDKVIQSNIYNAYLERPSLQALLPNLDGLNVLDLGCGSGVYLQYLLKQGINQATCIDYSLDMVNIVKSKLEQWETKVQVNAYVQDLNSGLPSESDSCFDLVISPLMIHYLEDLNPLFQDVERVLKPGGYFVFSTHHPFADFECSMSGDYFARERIQEEWNTIGEPVEVTFYRRSLSEITAAISQNGLVITELSEGKVSAEVEQIDPERFEYLSKNPNFIFIKCQKISE